VEPEIVDLLTGTDMDGVVEDDYDAEPIWAGASELVRAGWRSDVDLRRRLIVERVGTGPLRAVWVGGGGSNLLGQALAPLIEESVVVDPSLVQLRATPTAIGRTRRLYRGVAERLPLEDGWADLVDLPSVLDHVVDPDGAIVEAARVTRPGGVVTASLTNDRSWFRDVARRVRWTSFDAHDDHAHHFGLQELADRFRAAGLRDVHATTVMFLRLPASLDRFPARAAGAISRGADAVGRRVAPKRGGISIVIGTR
jgi:SAM-dependent methyltransferase